MSLTDKERADLHTLASGQISDAMEMLNLRRMVVHGLTLLGPSDTKIIGTAFTIRQMPKSADDARETPAVRHKEVSGGLAKSGDVVIVDVGGRTDVGSWGEFHSYRCKSNGVAGAIIHGATRDAPRIRTSGFPVMCCGVTPIKSRWDLKTAAINEPVALGAVEICPGDIVFGDESGVVVIPAAKKEVVLAKALEIRDEEDSERDKYA